MELDKTGMKAVMICQLNKVEMDNIREWAKHEGRPDRFKEFESKLQGEKKK